MMSENEVYERFLDIMFEEFTPDEMGYAHIVQAQAINDSADFEEEDGHA